MTYRQQPRSGIAGAGDEPQTDPSGAPAAGRDAEQAKPRVDVAATLASAPARWVHGALLVLGVAWALWLYRPWRPVPPPLGDFGEFLPVFTAHSSPIDAYAASVKHYMTQGRFMPVYMAALLMNWLAWGWDSVGWQWLKAAVMMAAAVAAFRLLRRFGASTAGAALGTSLFVCAGATYSAWLLPQIWDGLGVLFVFAATYIALDYQRTERPVRAALGSSVALALAAMISEPFVACVPFVLLVALCRHPDGSYRRPALSHRDWVLVAVTAGTLAVLVGLPRIAVHAAATATAYSSQYSAATITPDRVRNVLAGTLLPVTRVALFPANLALILIVLAGGAYLVARGPRHDGLRRLALALSLPLAGALIYLPWPAFPGYYAYKTLFGVALIVALALTWLERYGGVAARAGALALALAFLGYGSLMARNAAEDYAARRMVEAAAADALGEYAALGPVLLAVEDPARSGQFGRTLQQYAAARSGEGVPEVQEVRCGDAATALTSRAHAVVIALPDVCGALPGLSAPSREFQRGYVVRDWKRLGPERRSAAVRVWVGPPSAR